MIDQSSGKVTPRKATGEPWDKPAGHERPAGSACPALFPDGRSTTPWEKGQCHGLSGVPGTPQVDVGPGPRKVRASHECTRQGWIGAPASDGQSSLLY